MSEKIDYEITNTITAEEYFEIRTYELCNGLYQK